MSSAENEKTTPIPASGGPADTAAPGSPAAPGTTPAPTPSSWHDPDTTPAPAAAPARGPRSATIVGALVLILLGAGVAAVGVGARLDLQVALIVLLVVSGTALLVGAMMSSRRDRQRPPA